MIFEVWVGGDDECGEMTMISADEDQRDFLTLDTNGKRMKQLYTIEATNYFEAMEEWYRRMGWKPYKRPDDWEECV